MLCLHPLQTFAGEPRAELLRDVPCAVTAHEERDLQLGEELAGRLGMRPFRLDDEQKTLYHLSAVVGCNLLVALESEAKRLMDEATRDGQGLEHLAVAPAHDAWRTCCRAASPRTRSPGRWRAATWAPCARTCACSTARARAWRATYRALCLEALALAAPRLDDEQVDQTPPTELLGAPQDARTAGSDRRAHHRRGAGRAAPRCRARSASCPPWARCTTATSASSTRRGRAAPRSPPPSS